MFNRITEYTANFSYNTTMGLTTLPDFFFSYLHVSLINLNT